MSDQKIPIPAADPAGKQIDATELTTTAGVVERQRVAIGADNDPLGVVDVDNYEPEIADYGLVVRPVLSMADRTIRQNQELMLILEQAKVLYEIDAAESASAGGYGHEVR